MATRCPPDNPQMTEADVMSLALLIYESTLIAIQYESADNRNGNLTPGTSACS